MLGQRALPRPLLFQASAIQGDQEPGGRSHSIATPALGRVAPVAIDELPPVEASGNILRTLPSGSLALAAPETGSVSGFWALARLEAGEALLLGLVNSVLGLVALLLLRTGPQLAYPALWPLLAPLHLAVSWALLMVPIVLIGQSPLMGLLGLRLAAEQPERRMAFSLFHLLSVALFPLSFLCMVLTPNHRSLAELLTGQEILYRS